MVLTDVENVVPLLETNIQLNECKNVSAETLFWGNEDNLE